MLLYEFHPVDLHGGLLLIGVGALPRSRSSCMTRAYKRGKPDRRGQPGLHRNRLRQPVRHGDLGEVLRPGLGGHRPDRRQRHRGLPLSRATIRPNRIKLKTPSGITTNLNHGVLQ